MVTFESNIPLKKKTSFRIGGNALVYAKVYNEQEIEYCLKWVQKQNLPLFVIGKGTNVLISDSGWRGLVIDMSHFTDIQWNHETVRCQGGSLLHSVVQQAVFKGYGGIEKLAGIPGSIGGGIIMNAGAFAQTISDTLVSVRILDQQRLVIETLDSSMIEFGYRTSSLKHNKSVILGAIFQFVQGDKEKLKNVFYEILQRRREKQPLNFPNCGSVFKRPKDAYAGQLIEQVGLKGFGIGDAMISPIHANFIINKGNATASDVRKLIIMTQKKVYMKTNILLEPEVIFIGDFDVPLFVPDR